MKYIIFVSIEVSEDDTSLCKFINMCKRTILKIAMDIWKATKALNKCDLALFDR